MQNNEEKYLKQYESQALNFFYLLQRKLLKNDEYTFYFILKALSVLKIFTFLSDLFGSAGNRLDTKFLTSQTGTQRITINILPEIYQKVKAIRQ